MNRSRKAVLLLIFVLLALSLTALVCSASPTSPTGSTVRKDDHGYTVKISGVSYYYTTLAKAITDVPSGGTVTLLRNTEEVCPALGVSRTYTIDGAGYSITLTPDKSVNIGYTTDKTALHFYAGNVTLRSLTLLLADGTVANSSIYMQNKSRTVGKTSLTLEDVVMEFSSTWGIWLHQENVLTIKGSKTSIAGGAQNMIRMQEGANASIVNIEDGVISGVDAAVALVEMKGAGGSLTVTGGTLLMGKSLVHGTKSGLNVSFSSTNIMPMLAGASLFTFSSTSYATGLTAVFSEVCLYLKSDSGLPDLTYADTYGIKLVLTSGQIPIDESITLTSPEDAHVLVENYLQNEMLGTYSVSEFASVSAKADKWFTLVIRNGAIVTVTGGTYVIDEAIPMFLIEDGSLFIVGGSFAHSAQGGRLFEINNDASLTITGGSFSSEGVIAYSHAGAVPAINIEGGFFVMGEGATALLQAATPLLTPTVSGLTLLASSNRFSIYDGAALNTSAFNTSYGGKQYTAYFCAAPTDSSLDAANADPDFSGASVLITPDYESSGIRFITVLSDGLIKQLKKLSYTTISFGTVIAPLDYVTAAGAFTTNALGDVIAATVQYVKVKADRSIRDANGDGIPESYSAALVSLKTGNYSRQFAAVSYIEIDGKMYYGSFDAAQNARSIEDIAKKAIVAGNYKDNDELQALMVYAGFKYTTIQPDTIHFDEGYVTPEGRVVREAGNYLVSSVIKMYKGSRLTFVDSSGSAADDSVLVISRWKNATRIDTAHISYRGGDPAIAYRTENETVYSYVSESEEYVRITYLADGAGEGAPAVYHTTTHARGTDSVGSCMGDVPCFSAFAVGGKSLGEYRIVYADTPTVSEWHLALKLQALLLEKTGYYLPLVKASAAGNVPAVLIGAASGVQTFGARHEFVSEVTEGSWHLTAESLYGYDALYTYLESELLAVGGKSLQLPVGTRLVGSGEGLSTEPLETDSEVRMLFNNVWGSATYNVARRVQMLAELYAEYLPDILGLQEYSPAVRDKLAPMLAALGYVEIDAGTAGPFYGSEKYTRTPIFYRAETVELLEGGYSCIATVTDYAAYPDLLGSYTAAEMRTLGIKDRSKSVTYGVFRMKATGHIFLAGSTHLHYSATAEPADVARALQMQKLKEVLFEVSADFMASRGLSGTLPVFVGGDFNSRISYGNSYSTMAGYGIPFTNLNDLVDSAHALTSGTCYTSPVYNAELDIWERAATQVYAYDRALDHIFVNETANGLFTVEHMGMLEEEYAYASDHLAIFADLTFGVDAPVL